jgi:anti-sigma-K factor RskA
LNIQQYIESGIIETYVLGLASPSESAEFEQLCAQYPELVAARTKFEEGLEKHALANAELLSTGVKVKVLEAIGDTTAAGARESVSLNPPKIITMQNESKKGSSGWLRYIAAASVVLLIGLAWFSYQFYSQNAELQRSNTALQEKLNSTQGTLDKIVQEQSIVKDPNTTVVNMVGTKVAPRSSANVYWDSTNSNVYLVVKNMPKLPSDKQYQLWALIDGEKQPRDLGVFDATDDKIILKMKNTKKAQAFAITIEKTGGNPSPTLDSMQSLGKTLQSQ